MYSVWLRLAGAALLPVLLAVAFRLAEKRTAFGRLSSRRRQIVIGVAFGGVAVLATEFGIPMDGAVLNARNAAPLTAGMVFGWHAGVLAGLIGGIERWFATLWGVGEFTRLACSVSTILAGFLGAGVHRYMMENRKASWAYGLAAGIVTEVFHMLLVFVFNAGEIYRAFEAVHTCAVPMILANGLSVMLAMIAVSRLDREHGPRKKEMPSISQSFQRYLLICVLAAFTVTTLFAANFENILAYESTNRLLGQNITDVQRDIGDAADEALLSLTRRIAEAMPEDKDREEIATLARQYDVSEIHWIDENGINSASSEPSFEGFDFASGEQSSEFLCLLEGEEEYVQEYQPISSNKELSRKYAGVALESGGFVQVGYDAARFQSEINQQVRLAAKNRHIGQDGCIVICDMNGTIISDRDGHEGESITLLGTVDAKDGKEFKRYRRDIYGVDSYCMYAQAEGYYVMAVLPVEEAMFSRDASVYILAFMETIVFAALFAHVFFLIRKLIVKNIRKVNSSLAEITGGNLNVTVDVRGNEEFEALSDDINSTVKTLKHYIGEAEARIDKELEFARTIQRSALRSIFPAFPHRKEFSIFASMDAAKLVGGDFYDFSLLGRRKLAFLIADVSGKGVPAAMFMMQAKTQIKSLVESGLDVGEAMTQANAKLCEGNDACMFVTAWLGILNLETGILSYTNAGHNPPIVKRNGKYEYVACKPGVVLALSPGMEYEIEEIQLQPGDEVYLYTDGVTEANNMSGALYGEDRLLEVLNTPGARSVRGTCSLVRRDVDAFVGKAEQFDDITMLCVRLNAKHMDSLLVTVPDKESMALAADFLDEEVAELGISEELSTRLLIAADEIYSNIVKYSGAGTAEIELRVEDGEIVLEFRDDGTPYNPLDAATPDTTKPLEERPVGGLGIFIVRNTMDSVEYARVDGFNRLTLKARIE